MGKVAIVTGASSGIGTETVKQMVINGYEVIATGRDRNKLKELYHQTENVFPIELDVLDRDAIKIFFNSIKNRFGYIDLLVNNAGVMYLSRIEDGEENGWENMIDTNLKGLIYCSYEYVKQIGNVGKGHIINIASIAGMRVHPERVIYSSTKSAVRSFSEGLRQELLSKNIRVSVISPGIVDTNILRNIYIPEIKEKIATRKLMPLNPKDIASAVVFTVNQPEHVNVSEIVIRPTKQKD